MIEIVGGAAQSGAARAYGADPLARSCGSTGSFDAPAVAVNCICVDDADLTRMHDLMAIGMSQRDACLAVWSPAEARPLTALEQIRLSFQTRFPWLRFPWAEVPS